MRQCSWLNVPCVRTFRTTIIVFFFVSRRVVSQNKTAICLPHPNASCAPASNIFQYTAYWWLYRAWKDCDECIMRTYGRSFCKIVGFMSMCVCVCVHSTAAPIYASQRVWVCVDFHMAKHTHEHWIKALRCNVHSKSCNSMLQSGEACTVDVCVIRYLSAISHTWIRAWLLEHRIGVSTEMRPKEHVQLRHFICIPVAHSSV